MVWKLKSLERQRARQHASANTTREPKLLSTTPQFQIELSKKTNLYLIGWKKSVASVAIAEYLNSYPMRIVFPARLPRIAFSQTLLAESS